MQHIEVNGAQLEYFELGSGTPIVFVHGAPSDCRMWKPHCAILAGQYRTIAYTQRYFGTAKWQEDGPPFGVRSHADDLMKLVRQLDAGPVHLVAWSYGGHVALTALTEEPRLFRSALIYEPGFPTYVTDPSELAAISEDASSMFAPVFQAVNAQENDEAVRRLLDGSGQQPGYFKSQSVERQRVQLENAHVLPRLLSQTPPPVLTCEQLSQIATRVTIAWGERTRPAFALVSRAAARCIGGDWHMTVPGATHMWPEEDPQGFAHLVEQSIRAAA